jgi:TPR repeat protein
VKKSLLLFFVLINCLNALTFEEVYTIQKNEGSMKALSGYKQLAQENDPKAIHELAIIYLTGDKIAKNINKAHELFKKASELGNADSTYFLAKIYLSDKTIYFDEKKAYNTFVDAANQNNAKAQLMIGRFFLMGGIVPKDYEKALHYFKLASKQKEYDANCYIAYMYASGTGVFPNFGRANTFAKDEYEKGNKLCVKVWNDYNLGKYPKDEGFRIGDYNEPVK